MPLPQRVAPQQKSVLGGGAARAARPPERFQQREVVVRTPPPPAPVSFVKQHRLSKPMEADRRPSLKCVKCRCRPRTRNRLVRTARSRHPPRLRLRKTSVPTGPVSRRTTTAIDRVSHKRMFNPMYKTIRTGHRPPTTRDNRSPMCKIFKQAASLQ